jgi:hypothetical protein
VYRVYPAVSCTDTLKKIVQMRGFCALRDEASAVLVSRSDVLGCGLEPVTA